MRFNKVLPIIILLAKNNYCANLVFDYSEDLIISSITNCFGIKHYIIVKTNDYQNIETMNVKRLSSDNIMSRIVTYNELFEFLSIGFFQNVKTMILVKEKNLREFILIFQALKNMNILHRIHYFTWFVFVEFNEFMLEDSKYLLIPYNCQFIISFSIGGKARKLMEVYRVKDRTFFTNLGILKNNEATLNCDYLYSRRIDLNGTGLQVDTQNLPQIEWSHRHARQYEILLIISKFINFKYEYFPLDVARLEKNDIPGELCDMPFPFSAEIYTPDFLGPMFRSVTNWYIKYPDVAEEQADYYIKPFHPNLWACILGIIIFCGLWSIFLEKISEQFINLEKNSLVDLAFLGFESFCDQIGSLDFKRLSFHILSLSVCVAPLYLIPAYGAMITSFLTVKIVEVPFRNVEEFVKDGSYMVAYYDDHFINYYLKTSRDVTYRRIYDSYSWRLSSKCEWPLLKEKFCLGKTALVSLDNDYHVATSHMYDFKCNFYKIEQPMAVNFNGAVLKRNSQFKEVFNYVLIQCYNSGIIEKGQKLTQDYSAKTVTLSEEPFKQVTIKQMFQVFWIVGIGVILSVVILFMELSFSREIHVKRKKEI